MALTIINMGCTFMKILIVFALMIYSINSHASSNILNESEILNFTQLEISSILKETERSLEAHLFQEAHGRSCGLKHYNVEAYETSNDLLKQALSEFSVISEVYGPIYLCKGYEYFLCATRWAKVANDWKALGTSCESDHDWGALLYDHNID